VLKVRAYTAQDAHKINDLLLKMGERLVNNLNNNLGPVLHKMLARIQVLHKIIQHSLVQLKLARQVLHHSLQAALHRQQQQVPKVHLDPVEAVR
jgi:hypothetical protein